MCLLGVLLIAQPNWLFGSSNIASISASGVVCQEPTGQGWCMQQEAVLQWQNAR